MLATIKAPHLVVSYLQIDLSQWTFDDLQIKIVKIWLMFEPRFNLNKIKDIVVKVIKQLKLQKYWDTCPEL